MSATSRLWLLGCFKLIAADGTLAIALGKGFAVLAYLACARVRQASRQVLTDLLRHDSGREISRSSRRQVLFTIVPNMCPKIVSRLRDCMLDGRRHPSRGGLDRVLVYGLGLTAGRLHALSGEQRPSSDRQCGGHAPEGATP